MKQRRRFLSAALAPFIIFFLMPDLNAHRDLGSDEALDIADQEIRINRKYLIEDVRQLADILETSHPDPYSGGGGRIHFHYRLHKILNALPENGLTKNEFIKLLRPFLAAIGDQHTSLYTDYAINDSAPGGLPFVFGVVEQDLYVQVSFLETDQEYLGSILVSVEGVSVPELVRRFKLLEGCENDLFALRQLARNNLLFEPYVRELIPEWADTKRITFVLKRPSGHVEKVTRTLPVEIKPPLRFAESSIVLPRPDGSGFLWDFIDPLNTGKEVAYLRVDHMSGYREAHEMSVAEGSENASEEDLKAMVSATESFRSFVDEMKKRNEETLVIDLRRNGGGNYMMAPILVYFLYGKDVLTSMHKHVAESGGGHGERYSTLYFQALPKMTLQSINEGRAVPLIMGDIDFARIFADAEETRDEAGRLMENPERLKTFSRASTFYQEYQSEMYSGRYRPKNVVVLMTPWTSSSGLDMALYLWRAGATLIGTPSAQSPNSWGELLEWQLKHSGIRGEVSRSFDIAFGDNPELGRILPVHYPLTYEKVKSYNFDVNAEFLYAMELLPTLNR